MSDDDDESGLPDSDPRHIDPAGDLADLIESGEFDIEHEGDPEELREFIERAEAGEFGEVDPGLEAAVRIAREMLSDGDDS